MSVKQKAVEDIKKFAKMFNGFLAIAEDLESLDSIEQAIQESKVRLQSCQSAEAEAFAAKAKAQVELDLVVSKASEIESGAKASAKAMLDEAKVRIAEMDKASQERVKEMEVACSKLKADSDAELMKAGASLTEIVMKKADTQKALDELVAKLNELKAKFN